MAREFTRVFTLDDGETEVEVNFSVASWGSAGNGWDDPGEGPEIEVDEGTIVGTDDVVQLTQAEIDRFTDEVSENIDDYADQGEDDDAERDRRIDDRLTGGEG